MAAAAGYLTTLKLGGTPTAFTDEATTRVTENTVYQITAATKRVLDPATAVVVEVDATGGDSWAEADASTYALDYLTGTVTFAEDQGSSAAVRFASGKYVPLLTVGTAYSASLEFGREEIDTAKFNEAGGSAIAGRQVATISAEVREDLTTDHDSGAGTTKLVTAILAGSPMFVDCQPGGSGNHLRAWVHPKPGKVQAGVSDAVGATFEGRQITRQATGQTDSVVCSWAA